MDQDLERLKQSLLKNQKDNYSGKKGDKLKKLVSDGQHPPFFFIACSDSRYDPNLFPDLDNGDAFLAEHIAALVPPYDAPESTAIAAAVDYAVEALKVKHIIIMGHTHCGGVKGLVEGKGPQKVVDWVSQAKNVLNHLPPSKSFAEKCGHAEKGTVRWSFENLKQYPSVAKALKNGTLQIHGWRYDIESGMVEAWDQDKKDFSPFFNSGSDKSADTKSKIKPPGR